MRAKVTFRRRGRIADEEHLSSGGWLGKRPKDKQLPKALRDIVQAWRMIYETDGAAPSRQDVRATLHALASIGNADAPRAVRALDDRTESLLVTAAVEIHLREHPQAAHVPEHVLNARDWTPEQVRGYAARALKDLPRARGGRPRTQAARHVEFARVLWRYWRRTSRTRPTLSRYAEGGTPFSRFAQDMFLRLGRPPSPRQLHRILSVAKRAG